MGKPSSLETYVFQGDLKAFDACLFNGVPLLLELRVYDHEADSVRRGKEVNYR